MAAVARRWCSFGLHGPGECAQEEEQGEADAVVCLAWPATEYNSKNDSVAASSGARPWWPREGTRREAIRRAGSGEVSHPGAPLLGVRRRARGREQGRAHAWLPRSRTRIAHRGNSTNRWRAPKWGKWDAVLGRLGSELVRGPKMKFGLHLMLSNFA